MLATELEINYLILSYLKEQKYKETIEVFLKESPILSNKFNPVIVKKNYIFILLFYLYR